MARADQRPRVSGRPFANHAAPEHTTCLAGIDLFTFKSCYIEDVSIAPCPVPLGEKADSICAAKGGECLAYIDGYYVMVALCTYSVVFVLGGHSPVRSALRLAIYTMSGALFLINVCIVC